MRSPIATVPPRGFRTLAAAVAAALPLALLSVGPGVWSAGAAATTLATATSATATSATSPAGSPTRGAAIGTDPYLAPQGNGGYDVVEYDVDLRYDARTHGIAAATVRLTISALQPLSDFTLDARKGLAVDRVRVGGAGADFRHAADKLAIRGFGTIRTGEQTVVTVTYSGDPRPVHDRSGRGKYGWLATPNGSVTFTEPTGTSAWVPSNDVFYDKATWRVRLTAPKGLLGVSTGRHLGTTARRATTVTRWQQDTAIQPYAQVVAFDRFQVSDKPIAGLPAFTAVAQHSGVTVETMRQRTEHAIEWLSARLGPYPFAATGAIVVRGANSAMETAGRPTYSSGSYNTSAATVLHEHAHQWFGNTLTAGNARDIWLHEGFATYLENVETAERTERPLADIVHEQYVWDGWGAKFRGQFGRVSLHEPTRRYLLNTTPYFRGQAALHALRLELGDETFWRVLRALGDGTGGPSSSTRDVIAEAEAVAGRSLSPWASAWVYSVVEQPLHEAPTHQSVVQQVGPYLLDAASDWIWDPRGRVLAEMRHAQKRWQPLDQLQVTKVATTGRGRSVRYYVDFRTKVGVVYPQSYASCLVFSKKDEEILAGSLLGVRFSKEYAVNRFTLTPCPSPRELRR